MKTAGHAVRRQRRAPSRSACCALLVIPVPLLRSMGLGGMLIPLVSVASSCSRCCRRCSAASVRGSTGRGSGTRAGRPRPGPRWARLVVRRRWLAAAAPRSSCSALLIAPVFGIKIGQAQTELAGEQRAGVRDPADPAGRRRRRTASSRRSRCSSPATTRRRRRGRRRGRDGRRRRARSRPTTRGGARTAAAIVDVIPPDETVDSDERPRGRPAYATRSTGVAGRRRASPASGATVLDYINAVYENFPLQSWRLIALVTFLLLVRTFRSIAAADQGGRAQPDLGGRDVRRDRAGSGRRVTARRRSSASRPPARSRSGCRC